MLRRRLPILCEVLLLVNAINDTNLYEDINISDKNNIVENQDIEYSESYENNQISDKPIFSKEKERETFNGDLDYAGPVDTGRRKGNKRYSQYQ